VFDRQGLEIDLWREVCRHREIADSVDAIARLLGERMPIDRLCVRLIDPERCGVETIADAGPREKQHGARMNCTDSQMKKVLAWCRRGEATWGDSARFPPVVWNALVQRQSGGFALAVPLSVQGNRFGALVLTASADETFDSQHIEMAKMLLDPISLALNNDQQLREMAAMREAAEAEKQSLLARLGREKLADTIVGADSGLRAVMERVELVVRSDVPVLLFGETGAGKELIARAIHTRSRRAAGPFLRVNCGAIPAELIDSQLFGHERGAFTGAVETRKGWFERADGGTLLLDEIGELPLAAQVRLLRIAQDGWMERVGGHQPISVDVRIVAATHRDLAAMVADGQFREDLWYRIAVFPIVLPPLRERREDIPELARHFARRAATRFGLYPAMPTDADFARLAAYSWPGNIRELATVIDRAAILGDGKCLEVAKALGVTEDHAVPAIENHKPSLPPAPAADISSLDDAIRFHIESALRKTNGRIEGPHGAAVLLDVNPHTLRARMRKLGIDWKTFRRK
jgi:hydrogenase-4 transcriptional activator